MISDFESVVHVTGARLHRSALLLTGDPYAAEDLAQSAYAKVFASWRRVQRSENPVAYAHTTLLNTFLSGKRLRLSGGLPTGTVPERTAEVGDHDSRIDLLDSAVDRSHQLAAIDRTAALALRQVRRRTARNIASVPSTCGQSCCVRSRTTSSRSARTASTTRVVSATTGEQVA